VTLSSLEEKCGVFVFFITARLGWIECAVNPELHVFLPKRWNPSASAIGEPVKNVRL